MAEIQFAVKNESLAAVNGLNIEANFDECKAMLTEMMQPYSTMAVTEDGIAAAKGDRARIRKIAERINDARKTVKAAYSVPLEAFEAKCKDLTAICNNASFNLDYQIKGFEEAAKEKKLNSLRAYFDSKVGDAAEYLFWEDFVNVRWGNATYDMAKSMKEIDDTIDNCLDDLETIRKLGSPNETALLQFYKECHNLSACIRKDNDLKRIAELEEQRRIAREKQSISDGASGQTPKDRIAEMRAETIRNTLQRENPDHERIIGQKAEEPQEAEQVFQLDFRAWLTKSQMDLLRMFFTEHGIKFGRVPTTEASEADDD